MPAFEYEALSASGLRTRGTVEASDRGDAVRKLARKGLQPHSLNESGAADEPAKQKHEAPGAKSAAPQADGAPQRIILKRPQILQFTQELTDLLMAGLQLDQALQSMENRSSPVLGALCKRLREKVRDGVPFSAALNSVSPSFGELYCNLVAAGEASGSLTAILERQGIYLQTMERLRSRVVTALVYPSFIVVSGIVLGVVFVTYLLPKLVVLVKSASNGQMPAIATFLLGMSDLLKTWWWALLLLVGIAIAAVRLFLQNKERRKQWHRASLSLPIYGPLLRTRFEVQFLETLGNLLTNGLPLNRALGLTRNTTGNLYLREQLGTVESLVADGGSLSRALEKTQAARPLVVDMVRVGEQTGELATAVRKAAERFDSQLSKVIDRATSALEPVIIVCMAGMVGTMAWMMISVVYKTLENLQR